MAGLATEVLNCLRILLAVPTPSSSKMHHMLRRAFGLEHVQKIVKLGDMLDDVILRSRMQPNNATAESAEKSSSKHVFFSDKFERLYSF